MNFAEFFDGYIEAALWSSGHTPLDTLGYTIESLHEDSRKALKSDAGRFFQRYGELLKDHAEVLLDTVDSLDGTLWGYCGHNLWLSRNGHGSGFMDYKGVASAALHAAVGYGTDYPPIELVIGDDGLVHVEGLIVKVS